MFTAIQEQRAPRALRASVAIRSPPSCNIAGPHPLILFARSKPLVQFGAGLPDGAVRGEVSRAPRAHPVAFAIQYRLAPGGTATQRQVAVGVSDGVQRGRGSSRDGAGDAARYASDQAVQQ